jgi:hypothetical protein
MSILQYKFLEDGNSALSSLQHVSLTFSICSMLCLKGEPTLQKPIESVPPNCDAGHPGPWSVCKLYAIQRWERKGQPCRAGEVVRDHLGMLELPKCGAVLSKLHALACSVLTTILGTVGVTNPILLHEAMNMLEGVEDRGTQCWWQKPVTSKFWCKPELSPHQMQPFQL